MFEYIKVYFITIRTFVCFQRKRVSFNSFIDRDWLGKVVVTLFKKHSNGIDVLGIFFAKDGPISTKYLLNSLAISSSPVFILSPILSFLGKFDFLLSLYTIYRFFNSPPFLYVLFELEYLLWVVIFLDVFGGQWKNNSGWALQNLKNCHVHVSVKKHLKWLRSIHHIRTPKRLCCY